MLPNQTPDLPDAAAGIEKAGGADSSMAIDRTFQQPHSARGQLGTLGVNVIYLDGEHIPAPASTG